MKVETERKRPSRRLTWCVLAAVLTALCTGILLWQYCGVRTQPHLRAAGIPVGDMTRVQVRKALKEMAERLSGEDMVIRLPEEELRLSPEATGAALRMGEAVRTIFAFEGGAEGDGEKTVSLLHCLRLDEDAIHAALEAYAGQYDSEYSDWSYVLEGQRPGLEEDVYREDAPGQTLLLTMGTPGQKLDVDEVYSRVLEAYDSGSFLVEVEAPPADVPEAPDLEAILREIESEPVDASLNLETYERQTAVYGYGFDLEQARKLVEKAEYGESVSIPLEAVAPEILGDGVYFRDVLGEYNSGHSNRPNIVNNLELVCSFLDGTVIQPGEEFSYNDTVGERTVERGFLYGESFTGFSQSRSAGGGVCQGSSVLYVCALTAELEILERVNHGMEVSYTPPGQDAAVSWEGPDFRFRNNTHFPIQITAELAEGQMRVKLLGTDEKDYYIKLESTYGRDAHQSYANVYMCKYDKQTDALLSREKVSHSAYRLLT